MVESLPLVAVTEIVARIQRAYVYEILCLHEVFFPLKSLS